MSGGQSISHLLINQLINRSINQLFIQSINRWFHPHCFAAHTSCSTPPTVTGVSGLNRFTTHLAASATLTNDTGYTNINVTPGLVRRSTSSSAPVTSSSTPAAAAAPVKAETPATMAAPSGGGGGGEKRKHDVSVGDDVTPAEAKRRKIPGDVAIETVREVMTTITEDPEQMVGPEAKNRARKKTKISKKGSLFEGCRK